ncbi:hypothetical protein B0H11DRAFT_1919710 [Mycena galericulata]|nr:hypothetical protein B0H11DRAFT_1919710 [Mycena galericulata]
MSNVEKKQRGFRTPAPDRVRIRGAKIRLRLRFRTTTIKSGGGDWLQSVAESARPEAGALPVAELVIRVRWRKERRHRRVIASQIFESAEGAVEFRRRRFGVEIFDFSAPERSLGCLRYRQRQRVPAAGVCMGDRQQREVGLCGHRPWGRRRGVCFDFVNERWGFVEIVRDVPPENSRLPDPFNSKRLEPHGIVRRHTVTANGRDAECTGAESFP